MKPVFLLEGGPAIDRQFQEEGYVLNKTYSSAIAAAGGVPYWATQKELVSEYADFADALVLTGSLVFSPKPNSGFDDFKDRKDERTDLKRPLFDEFVKRKKLIIGICEGFQSINEFLGGSLDDDYKKKSGIEHMFTFHNSTVKEGSLLQEVFGDEFIINSRHNRTVRKLAKSLVATQFSPDGIIEAFEHKNLPIYGFEWHPERMRGDFREPIEGPDTTVLFEKFVELASV